MALNFRVAPIPSVTPVHADSNSSRTCATMQAMEWPPFVISANFLLCDRVLTESDNVVSAIRIIDTVAITPNPAGLAGPNGTHAEIFLQTLALLRSKPGHAGQHSAQVRLVSSTGVSSDLGTPLHVEFRPEEETTPAGCTFAYPILLGVRTFGTCYIQLLLDGALVAEAPLTLKPSANG